MFWEKADYMIYESRHIFIPPSLDNSFSGAGVFIPLGLDGLGILARAVEFSVFIPCFVALRGPYLVFLFAGIGRICLYISMGIGFS
jgi:hypothetical protein